MYKVFGGCSIKEKRKGNNAQKQQLENERAMQMTQNPFFAAPKPNACANAIRLCPANLLDLSGYKQMQ